MFLLRLLRFDVDEPPSVQLQKAIEDQIRYIQKECVNLYAFGIKNLPLNSHATRTTVFFHILHLLFRLWYKYNSPSSPSYKNYQRRTVRKYVAVPMSRKQIIYHCIPVSYFTLFSGCINMRTTKIQTAILNTKL